jgi:RHS repeat-associated protein
LPTRVHLDIEGNQREVIDAKGRIVIRYDYDMLGNRIRQASMEAGARWMLNDATGKPIQAWDSRGHYFRTEYDLLRRPVHQFVRGADANHADPRTLNREVLFERTEYGEGQANDIRLNLRTRVFRQYDGAGIVTNLGRNPATDSEEAYDFKGNLLRSSRQLTQDYKALPDWSVLPQMDGDIDRTSTTYDALNRPVTLTTPDNSVIRPTYNEANLLDAVEADLRGEQADGQPVWTPFVTDIDYDAKGQRTLIDYGNSVRTTYEYDPLTYRLVHLLTRRRPIDFPGDCPQPPPVGWPGCQVQNLRYTYDPVGNITHIRDDAQQTIYFRNRRVEPSNDYTYDAIYRLVEATGREHLGQNGGGAASYNDRPRVRVLLSASDGNAMGTYLQQYVYDEVGNLLEMIHRGADPARPGWRRAYAYIDASLTERGKVNNRLSETVLHPDGAQPILEPYAHDAHGNMVHMPHLANHPDPQAANIRWDFKDQMRQTDLLSGTAHYVYDAAGQRVRKVWEKAPGLIEERIYLGGFEVFRRRNGAGVVTLERETLHIMDDKQRIALVETRTHGNDGSPAQLIRSQFSNHLGSASLELDRQADIISYEEHYPYGGTSYQAVRSQTETPKRYRYTGKEQDEETGLYYHGARYYAPWTGRWVSCDPKGLGDGPNIYVALANNPPNTTDPNGMQATKPDADNPFARYAAAERALHEAIVSRAPEKEVSRLKAEYNEAAAAAQWGVDIPFLKFFASETAKAVIGELTGLALLRLLGWGVRLLANTRAGQYLFQPILALGAHVVRGVRSFFDRFSRVGRELAELEAQTLESFIGESFQRAFASAPKQLNPGYVPKQITAWAESVTEELGRTPIYRWVPKGHPRFPQAEQGVAFPGALIGHSDEVIHNLGAQDPLGRGTRTSQLTSWTRSRRLVEEIAEEAAESEGVILEHMAGEAPPPNAGWRFRWSPDAYGEEEVLVEGVIRGATVTSVKK